MFTCQWRAGNLNRPRTKSIHVLDNDSLLNIFYHYRPVLLLDENESDDPGRRHTTLHRREWDRERWWYKLAHVCRRWRYLVLGSTFYLGLCLYCTHGTPIADMLVHSPRIPLIIDYIDKGHDVTAEDKEGIVLALQQRDRVRRIRLELPVPKLRGLIMTMDEEFPILEYLFVGPPTKHNTGLVLPEAFRAPHLRHFFLTNFALSIGSPLLTTVTLLVTLVLQNIHPSAYFRPKSLLRHLSLIPQLETLTFSFNSPVHNRDIERDSLHVPIVTRATLPNLRYLGFKGASAYLEALLPHITAPLLERLQITFLNQLVFSTPRLLQFVNNAENLRLGSAVLTFREEAVRVRVYPSEEVRVCTFVMEVGCRHLDWQVAAAAQIFNEPGTLYSAVEHLTLDYNGSLKSPEPHNEDDRTQWRELLRPFNNVKTLSVPSSLVGELSHCLISDGEAPLELLHDLKELVCPSGQSGRDADAFASFIEARRVAGRPVLLAHMGLPVDSSRQHAQAGEPPQEHAPRREDSLVRVVLERATTDPPPGLHFEPRNRNAPASVNDLFIDGFISSTFSPQEAHDFFAHLLGTPNFLQHYHISYAQDVWYIMRTVPSPSSGLSCQNWLLPLDFNIKVTQGAVVPQRRWTPADEVDIRRHVAEAKLQLPIFFIHLNGGVGFWLPDILQGRDRDLCNRDSEALLGGLTSTHIRIDWPGYGYWKRQIPTRDETYARNPITLGRFMRHVATSVDKFFNQCMVRDQVNTRWGIGARGINQTHVKIIGAVHVSAGSWMPLMQLTRYVF